MWIKAIEAEPGEDILHACTEACRIAKQFDMSVWFDFNGIHMLARPASIPSEMTWGFHEAIDKGREWMEQRRDK